MKIADIPSRIGTPWGSSADPGFIRTPPVPSQIGITDGAASFATGFVPLNFQPIEVSGVPPFGQDFNGALNAITQWNRWQAAGSPMQYNSAFSTAIGGYPKGALLQSTAIGMFWLNAADDNTTDPDGGSPANWLKCFMGNYYAQDTGGSANVYSCSFAPPLTAHTPGLLIRLLIVHTSTGASTFNPTNTGVPKAIKLVTGADPTPGALTGGMIALFVYDGSFYQLLNPNLDSVYFKIANQLNECTPASVRGNIGLGPTDAVTLGALALTTGLLQTAPVGMQTFNGVTGSVAENTYTVLFAPGADSGVWLVQARRTDIGDHSSIGLFWGLNVSTNGVILGSPVSYDHRRFRCDLRSRSDGLWNTSEKEFRRWDRDHHLAGDQIDAGRLREN
jgi:hypothetical protein